MLVLARGCGLTTADSKVISIAGRDVLMVKRFDRVKTAAGYLRARMISGLTVLRADETHLDRQKWSYVLMAEELRRISAEPKRDAAELFRRMCFNALITNRDDHPRNHAFVAMDRDWRLSPAYDLTPQSPPSQEKRDLALICGDAGRYANRENLLSQSARFLLDQGEAATLIDAMENRVRDIWYATARAEGVSEPDCEKIRGAFVYPGFRLPMQTDAMVG
jgi:serine/threonine-protein kinase HipA